MDVKMFAGGHVKTIKMATHEKRARDGARGLGLGEGDAGGFFLSYLFPWSDFQVFKTIPNSEILLENGHKVTADVNPLTKPDILPPDLNDRSLQLFETLQELEISTESIKYVPKEDRQPDDETVYCKNLFLKDRKGRFYLVICHEEEVVDLKSLKQKLKAHRNFSFASASELSRILGVCSGEVTPLALPKDTDGQVTVAATHSVCCEEKLLNFHPLDRRYATRMSFADLLKFLSSRGHLLEKLTP